MKCYNNIAALGYNIGNHYFVYDRYSNFILSVSKDIYERLDDLCGSISYGKMGRRLMEELQQVRLESNILIQGNIPKYDENDLINLFAKKHRTELLSLYVTERCNLKCSYCYRKDNINGKPLHNMSWKIAGDSIDSFLKESESRDHITISFFGGEPLVNYDLIKK